MARAFSVQSGSCPTAAKKSVHSSVRAERLVITCGPCDRCGVYRIDGLRQRFGDHASVLDVYLRLTQTCRYQREVGSRQPNVYGVG